MRLIVDENVDGAIIEWLRAQDHDVLSISESNSGIDPEILDLAEREGRIPLTFDKDFSDLAFRQRSRHPGIIQPRLRATDRSRLVGIFASLWNEIERGAVGGFTTVQNHSIRRRALP